MPAASRKDRDAHKHRVNKGESGYIHIDTVGKPQKPESREDGDRVGERGTQGTADAASFFSFDHFSCHGKHILKYNKITCLIMIAFCEDKFNDAIENNFE